MLKFAANIQVEETIQTETVYLSDCCGVYMSENDIAHEICPDCWEHCIVNIEEYPIRR